MLITTGLVACGRPGEATAIQQETGNSMLNSGNTTSLGNLATPLPPGSNLLDANLPAISDYSRSHIYADLVKQARLFGNVEKSWA